jgi:hypothetical protein
MRPPPPCPPWDARFFASAARRTNRQHKRHEELTRWPDAGQAAGKRVMSKMPPNSVRPGSYASHTPARADEFMGGAYIPEMMQGLQQHDFGQVQSSHSNAKGLAELPSHHPEATFVGQPAGSTPRGGYGQRPDSARRRLLPGEDGQVPRKLENAFTNGGHEPQENGGPAGRPCSPQNFETHGGGASNPGTPRRNYNQQQPLTPRNSNAMSTPRSSGGLLTPRGRNMTSAGRSRSMTPETRDSYVATKGGWIQTSVTISDMSIAAWTQQKQDLFIEAVAATAQVKCVLLTCLPSSAANGFTFLYNSVACDWVVRTLSRLVYQTCASCR